MAKKVDNRYLAQLREEVEELSGIERALVDPLLEEVAAMREMTRELRLMVERDGVMIEVTKGGANNRHTELVENPALTAYSKLAGRLSDLSKKVSGFAKGSGSEEKEEDLVSFAARR